MTKVLEIKKDQAVYFKEELQVRPTGHRVHTELAENHHFSNFANIEQDKDDDFFIDLQRVIFSSSFRRMEYKTQVFSYNTGDHFRNRLTHSIEVANIAKFIAKKLHLNFTLSEVIAIAHDIGHAPFGHSGEEAINEVIEEVETMFDTQINYRFNHNIHVFTLLNQLEKAFIPFDGLNLTAETLQGILKHNGPLIDSKTNWCYYDQRSMSSLLEYNKANGNFLELEKRSHLEGQVAAIADDIAYNAHDFEDGLRAGTFTIHEICDEIPEIKSIVLSLEKKHNMKIISDSSSHRRKSMEDPAVVQEIKREITATLVEDVLLNSMKEIEKVSNGFSLKHDRLMKKIKGHGHNIVRFSNNSQDLVSRMQTFLHDKTYNGKKVSMENAKSFSIISSVFFFFLENPECLPERWMPKEGSTLNEAIEKLVYFIAGMTDKYIFNIYEENILPIYRG